MNVVVSTDLPLPLRRMAIISSNFGETPIFQFFPHFKQTLDIRSTIVDRYMSKPFNPNDFLGHSQFLGVGPTNVRVYAFDIFSVTMIS